MYSGFLHVPAPQTYTSTWFGPRGEQRKNPLGRYGILRGEPSDYRPRSESRDFEESYEEFPKPYPPDIPKEVPQQLPPISTPLLTWELSDSIGKESRDSLLTESVDVCSQKPVEKPIHYDLPLYMLGEICINIVVITLSNLQPLDGSVGCYMSKGGILAANLVLVAIIAFRFQYVRRADNWLFLAINLATTASCILDFASQKTIANYIVMGVMILTTLRGLIDVFLSIRNLCKSYLCGN